MSIKAWKKKIVAIAKIEGIKVPAMAFTKLYKEGMSASEVVSKVVAEEVDLDSMDWIAKVKLATTTKDPSILKELAKDEKKEVRQMVALNKKATSNILKELAKDEKKEVRARVAKNPNTHISVLKELAKDKEVLVRMYVASNVNSTTGILDILHDDKEEAVVLRVIENSNTPEKLLLLIFRNKPSKLIEEALKKVGFLK